MHQPGTHAGDATDTTGSIALPLRTTRVRRTAAVALALLLLPLPESTNLTCLARDKPKDTDSARIDKAVERGVAYLKSKQRKDGSWDGDGRDDGVTALAVYSLLKANCPLADPAVSRGIESILNAGSSSNRTRATTYAVSLTATALSSVIEKAAEDRDGPATNVNLAACRERLRGAADWLVAAQHTCRAEGSLNRGAKATKRPIAEVRLLPGGNGYDLRPYRGMDGGAWGYSLSDSNYVDNSNTQFALLGLRAAQNIRDYCSDTNISIPRDVWSKALARLTVSQAAPGEWDYGTPAMGTRGFQETMTAAGVSGLIICLSSLVPDPDLGKITQTPEVVKALARLEKYVYPPPNTVRLDSSGLRQPNRSGYMFYSLERACMLAGLPKLGDHDWHQDGAADLVHAQQPDGSWSGDAWYNAPDSRLKAPKFRDNTIETTFSLLFLTKAFVYTPAQKPYVPSNASAPAAWNR